MRILNWNIQQGGRCFEQSISLLVSKQADLIVLPEFRDNHAGDMFREGLRENGFHMKFVLPYMAAMLMVSNYR